VGRSLLADAFEHHLWATLRIIDACLTLDREQLGTVVPGTYGSILDTVRHIVGADRSYLHTLSGGRVPRIDEDGMELPDLRATMAGNEVVWSGVLAKDPESEAVLVREREDGSATRAPIGIRLAQALQHGTDHRSQICTALTTLGIQPPDIDVWDFGEHEGRVTEVPGSS